MKGVIRLLKDSTGTIWYLDSDFPITSVSKYLGGKDNVEISRQYSHHGYGGYITQWKIKNIDLAISKINELGCDCEVIDSTPTYKR